MAVILGAGVCNPFASRDHICYAIVAMIKRFLHRILFLPACICLGTPTDAHLPANYAAVIAAVHDVIRARAAGDDAAKNRMKENRKLLGKKHVFSEVSIDPKTMGTVLYHPTPFITGRNAMSAPDADGAYPVRQLITKVKDFADGQGMWIQYSIKDVVSGDKVQRHMYCEKFGLQLYCGSLPASYDLRAHLPVSLGH